MRAFFISFTIIILGLILSILSDKLQNAWVKRHRKGVLFYTSLLLISSIILTFFSLKGDNYDTKKKNSEEKSNPKYLFRNSLFNEGENDVMLLLSNQANSPCYDMNRLDCWSKNVKAKLGDTIRIRLYYHNTSDKAIHNVSLFLRPQSFNSVEYCRFQGGVFSESNPSISDTASVAFNEFMNLKYIFGSAKWLLSFNIDGSPVSNVELFGTGFNVGTVNSKSMGILFADFEVVKGN
ncbi:MAG: hypothetical protein IPP81_07320 [Chitinophagaceae bacterium]|nr:hypothetical protein [Chitinophagaceae bacterium]